jgi:uncharacterized membrane protein YccF (DUF307 family)
MGALGNFLWILLGGGFAALFWCLAGLLMFASIVGIPWGRACFTTANLVLLPFGREAVRAQSLAGRHLEGSGIGRALGNVAWFVLGGWYLALSHAFAGLFYCATVVGVPFGIQHFKLGGLALAPVGKRIVTKEEAQILRTESAHARIQASRA